MANPRLNRRTLAIGLGLLLLALFAIPLARLDRSAVQQADPGNRNVPFEPIAARTEPPAAPLTLESALPPEDQPAEDPAPATRRPEPEPFPEPPAFENLTIVDPWTNARTTPVPFTELRPAFAPAEEPVAEAAADVEVYVPGCVASAKRRWAGGTSSTGRPGRGCRQDREIVIPVTTGMCANPSRDRGLPAMCGRSQSSDSLRRRSDPPLPSHR